MRAVSLVCLLSLVPVASQAVNWTVLAPPPDGPPARLTVITQRLPTKLETYSRGVDGTSFTVITPPGSPLAGLLLGPVGVAAAAARNQKDSRTAADAFTAVLATDLPALLQAQIPADGLSAVDPSQRHYEVIPIGVLAAQPKSGTFNINCILHAYLLDRGKTIWHGRYQVVSYELRRIAAPGDQQQAVEAFAPCFAETWRLFSGHVEGRLLAGGRYKVRWPTGGTLKTPLIEHDLPGRVVVPDPQGLYELPASEFVGAIIVPHKQKTRR